MNTQSPEPRILKIVTCASLSGRTTITYHLGCRDKDDVCFRIWDTSGKGVFSKEWVCATDIQRVLGQCESINATSLLPVFKVGRSVNTAGFLLAALKHEGLVSLSADEAHRYVRMQSEQFIAETAALIKSGVSLDLAKDAQATPAGKKGRRKAGAPAWAASAQIDGKAAGE